MDYKQMTAPCGLACFDCVVYRANEDEAMRALVAEQFGILPHNTKMFNLCLIKRMGVEAWAKDKARDVKHAYFHGKWKM
jgi:hypothetical protein